MTEIGDELRRDLDAATGVEHIEVEKEIAKYDPEFRFRDLGGAWKWIVFAIAAGMSVFQLYTAGFGLMNPHEQRAVHLAFILALTFLLFPFLPGGRKTKSAPGTPTSVPWYDVLLAAAGAAVGLYILLDYQELVLRAGTPSTVDLALGFATILLVMEASRRIIGPPMAILATVFLAYASFGPHLPGVFAHKGYAVTDIAEYMYLTTKGIFGIPLGVSATYIFLFILLGAYLEQAGIISFFSDLAMSLVGHTKGGPAKVSVIASALLGMVNGSAIANVVTVGAFAVPLMKRTGFKAPRRGGGGDGLHGRADHAAGHGSGGVHHGGYAGDSLRADLQGGGDPRGAVLPRGRGHGPLRGRGGRGCTGFPKEELPRFRDVIGGRWYLLLPLAALVYLFLAGYTPLFAGFYGIVLTIALIMAQKLDYPRTAAKGSARFSSPASRWARRRPGGSAPTGSSASMRSLVVLSSGNEKTRRMLFDLVRSLHNGARSALGVAVACAVIGIVVGVATMTGLRVKLSGAIISLAGGNLFFTLVLTMVASLILGMGVPTIPTYIITSTMAAPALAVYGVPPLVAHMFVFYFGLLADLAPASRWRRSPAPA